MLKKGSGIVGLLGDIGHVGVPVDGDTKIFRTSNLPLDSAVDGVVTVYLPLFPVSNSYHLRLIRVELHQPVSFPLL